MVTNTFSYDVSVIIPCIKHGELLFKCIDECLKQGLNSEIIVISEEDKPKQTRYENVVFHQTGNISMSAKRNIGVQMCHSEFIAFTDSDAYPAENWLQNGLELLKNDPEIGIVGGPDISPPDQSYWENIVGAVSKSYLIRGSATFMKSVTPMRYIDFLQACNMVMRKSDYSAVNGFDETIYVAEDLEFSQRVNVQLGKKLLFSPDVCVYHRDRDFSGFFIQRLTRGIAIDSSLKFILKNIRAHCTLETILKQRWEIFVPLLFILFILSFWVMKIFRKWKYVYYTVLNLYGLVLLVESVRVSDSKIKIPLNFYLLCLGTLAPGIGTLLPMLGLTSNSEVSNYYRNKNDK